MSIEEIGAAWRRDFAPVISNQASFAEYVAVLPDEPEGEKNFFYNVFESEQEATAANALAADFVEQGSLNDDIERVEFWQGKIGAFVPGTTCQASLVNRFASWRFYDRKQGSAISANEVFAFAQGQFGPAAAQQPGFVEYGGAEIGTNQHAFYTVFETEAQATAGEASATVFVGDNLADDVELFRSLLGQTYFDFGQQLRFYGDESFCSPSSSLTVVTVTLALFSIIALLFL
jgi:hypothetical protein